MVTCLKKEGEPRLAYRVVPLAARCGCEFRGGAELLFGKWKQNIGRAMTPATAPRPTCAFLCYAGCGCTSFVPSFVCAGIICWQTEPPAMSEKPPQPVRGKQHRLQPTTEASGLALHFYIEFCVIHIRHTGYKVSTHVHNT